MPFLRFARDKRGYEHIYLMHAGNRRGKPGRPRLLYWYRTPPGVKVGRVPFDDEVRRALAAQYPGIVFDWQAIANTPMPPPDAEPWRERRRQERAAKQLRMTEEAALEIVEEPGLEGDTDALVAAGAEPVDIADAAVVMVASPDNDVFGAPADGDADATFDASEDEVDDAAADGEPVPAAGAGQAGPERGVRRRRRRRRRRRPQIALQTGAPDVAGVSAESAAAPIPDTVLDREPLSSDRASDDTNSSDR